MSNPSVPPPGHLPHHAPPPMLPQQMMPQPPLPAASRPGRPAFWRFLVTGAVSGVVAGIVAAAAAGIPGLTPMSIDMLAGATGVANATLWLILAGLIGIPYLATLGIFVGALSGALAPLVCLPRGRGPRTMLYVATFGALTTALLLLVGSWNPFGGWHAPNLWTFETMLMLIATTAAAAAFAPVLIFRRAPRTIPAPVIPAPVWG